MAADILRRLRALDVDLVGTAAHRMTVLPRSHAQERVPGGAAAEPGHGAGAVYASLLRMRTRLVQGVDLISTRASQDWSRPFSFFLPYREGVKPGRTLCRRSPSTQMSK